MEELREECPEEYDLPEEPVIWDEGQRAVWQAELDAIFANLYGRDSSIGRERNERLL